MEKIKENTTEIYTKENIFYNPHMELCRDISSLCVGAIKDKLRICDGFSATGIRGIRYLKENENIESLSLVDANKYALPLMKKNIKHNKLPAKKAKAYDEDILQHLFGKDYNFIELDPFGSPQSFLRSAIGEFASKSYIKTAYLSITATDTAVLCGAKRKACIKLYHSFPLNNFLCHEVGLRILLANISYAATEYDFSIEPLFSLSHRHYFKIIIKLEKGAEKAVETSRKIGYLEFNPNTLEIQTNELSTNTNKNWEIAGPLWLGELHNKEILEEMKKLNEMRNYKNKNELNKILDLLINEINMPVGFYTTDKLSRLLKKESPKLEKLISALNKKYKTTKTHFDSMGFKTRADIKQIKKDF
ncbi:MAG: methyltransferase [Candidatus Micrarchaeia archaeon]